MSSGIIDVVLVIPSALERLGWSIVIEEQADMRIVAQFTACEPALEFLAIHPVDAVVVDEAILMPNHCEDIHRHAGNQRTRLILMASYPISGDADNRYSLVSQRLLKGVAATSLLAAIRGLPASPE